MKTLDEYLDTVDYDYLNSNKYIPTEFALVFMSFIKLVNGSEGESNKTPTAHLSMLDKLITRKSNKIVNLCFRGMAKTTVFGEYLILYIACFGSLPKLGKVNAMMYVGDTVDNGVKSLRKNLEYRYDHSVFLQNMIPHAEFTDKYIEFKNKENHVLGVKLFGATTGIRGTKIFGKRPTLAILDDLISDEAAKSKATMDLIRNTVYKGIDYALDPENSLVIFNGTPFNKEDIIIQAVESGAWEVNVYPVCESFPCTKENFKGAWEDRFDYDYINTQYEFAKKSGMLQSFYQELMLRISTDEEKLIPPNCINWYNKSNLLKNKGYYNFYITTDFATSKKNSSDFSVISVWAYNSNGDWFWVDGICKRQTMDKNIDDLFRFVTAYSPQSVGIEVTGQQGAFIDWIRKEMMSRNIWFNLASNNNSNKPGIRPDVDKLSRFNLMVPLFKSNKIYFPFEDKDTETVKEAISEIDLVTYNGIKGKDDFLDTISMLAYIRAWKPSEGISSTRGSFNEWENRIVEESKSPLQSYLV